MVEPYLGRLRKHEDRIAKKASESLIDRLAIQCDPKHAGKDNRRARHRTKSILATEFAQQFDAVHFTMSEMFPHSGLCGFDLFLQAFALGNVEVDKQHGGEISDDLLNVGVVKFPAEECQIESEGRMS